MFKKLTILGLLLISLTVSAKPTTTIAPLKEGSLLPSISVNNQHGKLVKIKTDVKTIFFSAEKAPSQVINLFLKKNPEFLVKQNAYLVANISGMPFLISKFVAIPKMKKYPYDVLLVKQKGLFSFMPHKEGQLSILKISNGKITSISFVKNEKELIEAFK